MALAAAFAPAPTLPPLARSLPQRLAASTSGRRGRSSAAGAATTAASVAFAVVPPPGVVVPPRRFRHVRRATAGGWPPLPPLPLPLHRMGRPAAAASAAAALSTSAALSIPPPPPPPAPRKVVLAGPPSPALAALAAHYTPTSEVVVLTPPRGVLRRHGGGSGGDTPLPGTRTVRWTDGSGWEAELIGEDVAVVHVPPGAGSLLRRWDQQVVAEHVDATAGAAAALTAAVTAAAAAAASAGAATTESAGKAGGPPPSAALPPRVLVHVGCAVCHYGITRRASPVTEASPAGRGWLCASAVAAEAAAAAAASTSTRVVTLRAGVVLAPQWGVLAGGVGTVGRAGGVAVLGGGAQPISWVGLPALTAAVAAAVDGRGGGVDQTPSTAPVTGVYNVVGGVARADALGAAVRAAAGWAGSGGWRLQLREGVLDWLYGEASELATGGVAVSTARPPLGGGGGGRRSLVDELRAVL